MLDRLGLANFTPVRNDVKTRLEDISKNTIKKGILQNIRKIKSKFRATGTPMKHQGEGGDDRCIIFIAVSKSAGTGLPGGVIKPPLLPPVCRCGFILQGIFPIIPLVDNGLPPAWKPVSVFS